MCTLLLHPVDCVGDIERFLQRRETRGTSIAIAAHVRLKKRGVKRSVSGMSDGRGRWRRRSHAPLVLQEFINRVSLCGIDAK